MPLNIYDPPGNKQLSKCERKLLKRSIGKRVCDNSTFSKGVNILTMAIVSTILFVVLSLSIVDDWLAIYIPDYTFRLIAKAVLFFIIIYVVDLQLVSWRLRCNICC